MLFQPAPFCGRHLFPQFLNERRLVGDAVEVGTHRGYFAYDILAAWKGRHLYCVDPYVSGYCDGDPASESNRAEDEAEAKRVLAPYAERVTHIRAMSTDAAASFLDDSFDFVYVDANHDRFHTVSDLCAWWPKIRSGGILAGHDFMERNYHLHGKGVQPAVTDFANSHGVPNIFLVAEIPEGPWSYYMEKP